MKLQEQTTNLEISKREEWEEHMTLAEAQKRGYKIPGSLLVELKGK